MKFKNKTDIYSKYLIIYASFILQTNAARPFSTGPTRSSYSSGFSGYRPTNVGYKAPKLNIGEKPFISIADSKRALQSTSNIESRSKIGFSPLNTHPVYNTNLESRFSNSQTSYNPTNDYGFLYNIDLRKEGRTRRPPRQPAPLYTTAVQNTVSNKVITTKPPGIDGPKLPTANNATNNATKMLTMQLAYNPFNITAQTNTNTNVSSMPQQPAYNPYYNPSKNLSPHFSPPSIGLNAPPNQQISNIFKQKLINSTHIGLKNVTQKNSTSPMDFINSFPNFKTLNLNLDNNKKGEVNRGYTTTTINRLNFFKSQQDLKKEFQNQKPNNDRNKIVAIVTLVIILTVGIGIAVFWKVIN